MYPKDFAKAESLPVGIHPLRETSPRGYLPAPRLCRGAGRCLDKESSEAVTIWLQGSCCNNIYGTAFVEPSKFCLHGKDIPI